MRVDTLQHHRALVASALELIQRDLAGDLTLDALAARAGVSPYHFHRLFSSIAGEPPASYVRRLRLERAALQLKYTQRPVTDVAFEAGYETHEAFTRAFKSTFGVPPRQFRAREARLGPAVEIHPAIARLPSRRIAYVRHVGPYQAIGGAFVKVLEWARSRGLDGAPLIGVYWDDQAITPPQRTRCEVGVIVGDDVAGDDAVADGDIAIRRLSGGDHAVLHHEGSSRDRRRTYDQLFGRWLPERGLKPAFGEAPFEVYSTDGGLDALDRVTSVHVPLAPRRAA